MKGERIVLLISLIIGIIVAWLVLHDNPQVQIAFKDPIKMEEYAALAQEAIYLTHNYNLSYVEELKSKGIEVESSIENNTWKLEINNSSRHIKVTADIPITIDMNVNNGTIDLKGKIDYEDFQYATSSTVLSKAEYVFVAFLFVVLFLMLGCVGIELRISRKKIKNLTKTTEVDEDIY